MLVHVNNLTKTYGNLTLFRDLSFTVTAGEMIAIVGSSGTGKSTLLHMLAAMDTPTSGDVTIGGTSLASLNPQQQADFRNRIIGYVWQAHYLLPEFTAEENVAMPLLARGESQPSAREKAAKWLAEVDLTDISHHRSGELSGGEQQRVSLARALVTAPKLLLADEPTGNLDSVTGDKIFDLLRSLHSTHGTTTVMVTHNLQIAARCDRTLVLHEGQLAAP